MSFRTVTKLLLLIVLLAGLAVNASAASEKIFIGILEPYTDISWEKEVESDWVRLPFFWDGKSWSAMPKIEQKITTDEEQAEVIKLYPEQLKFYAGRADKDGHQVYTLINTGAVRFNENNGANAPGYVIKSIDPTLVNYMAQDDNYCQWNNICKRPLILTTATTRVKEDHEGWTEEAELKADEKKLVYSALRKQFPTYKYCSDEQKTAEKKWKENDVNQIKIYRAKNQELLIGLQLNKDLDTCRLPNQTPFLAHWFYVDKSDVNFIGKNIMPIEYADYNGDGKSEWIFGEYGENDGYILFTDNFKTKLVYDWAYQQLQEAE